MLDQRALGTRPCDNLAMLVGDVGDWQLLGVDRSRIALLLRRIINNRIETHTVGELRICEWVGQRVGCSGIRGVGRTRQQRLDGRPILVLDRRLET